MKGNYQSKFPTLKEIQNWVGARLEGRGSRFISGLSIDSRRVEAGHLFFALPGEKVSGIDFASQACQKGAIGLVCTPEDEAKARNIPLPRLVTRHIRESLGQIASRFYGEPTRFLKTIGVTGTNGKTTTTYFLRHLLEEGKMSPGLLGTVEYVWKDYCQRASRTTPDALTLQSLACKMKNQGAKSLVMEVSSHGLEQKRVAGISFDGAIFTNLSGDHLDYHGTMEEYRRSKARLFQELSPGQVAIINGDDPQREYFASQTRARIYTYGMDNPDCHFRAQKVEMSLEESRFLLSSPAGTWPVTLPVIGRHNIYNALAAAACALAMGVTPRQVITGLAHLPSVPGRLERIPSPQGAHVFVDYAHTDDALENILSYLHSLKKGKIVTLFGCGGDRDRTKRPRMGKVASRWSDWVVVTSDNPRSEDPREIISHIEEGLTERNNYEVVVNRKKAIGRALKKVKKGDILLIAGKGHETYQEGKEGRIWFDDRVVARELMENSSAAA